MPQRIVISLIFIIVFVTQAMAQETTTATASSEDAVTATTTAASSIYDSAETRETLQSVLGKYPPQVAKVLKLDPALFGNQAYWPTTGLAAFVAQHPEIAHTPAF